MKLQHNSSGESSEDLIALIIAECRERKGKHEEEERREQMRRKQAGQESCDERTGMCVTLCRWIRTPVYVLNHILFPDCVEHKKPPAPVKGWIECYAEKSLFPDEQKCLPQISQAGRLRDAKHSFPFSLRLDRVLNAFCCGFFFARGGSFHNSCAFEPEGCSFCKQCCDVPVPPTHPPTHFPIPQFRCRVQLRTSTF